mgnify:FL=1
MLNTYIIPDPATVPDGYDLPAELTARGLPAQWVSRHDARLSFYDQAHGYDTEEDGGDALVWNPDTHEIWYLSRGDVEAARRATPGAPITHLRYSYFILTGDMRQDIAMLQHEGLTCLADVSHDGTGMEPAIDILDLYGEYGNLAYPGDMIVYDHGALYDAIPQEVCEAVRATA